LASPKSEMVSVTPVPVAVQVGPQPSRALLRPTPPGPRLSPSLSSRSRTILTPTPSRPASASGQQPCMVNCLLDRYACPPRIPPGAVCPALPVGITPPKTNRRRRDFRCRKALSLRESIGYFECDGSRVPGGAAAAACGGQHAGRHAHAESRARGRHRRASSNNASLRGAPQHTSPERGGGDFRILFYLLAAQA
jgi:hypothetical protein